MFQLLAQACRDIKGEISVETDKNLGKVTDNELLERLRLGDSEVFGELWERHRRPGYVAARNLSSAVDPEEMVQEAFARILELVQEGKGPSKNFRSYLYAVIRTVVLEHVKQDSEDSIDEVSEANFAMNDESIETSIDHGLARDAFQALPERLRKVLWLVEIEGLAPREAATRLQISPNQVSVMRKRGRAALRKAWLEAHVDASEADAACRDFRPLIVRGVTGGLRSKQQRSFESHIDGCSPCKNLKVEVKEMSGLVAASLAVLSAGVRTGATHSLASGTTVSSQGTVASVMGGTAHKTALSVMGKWTSALHTLAAPKLVTGAIASLLLLGGTGVLISAALPVKTERGIREAAVVLADDGEVSLATAEPRSDEQRNRKDDSDLRSGEAKPGSEQKGQTGRNTHTPTGEGPIPESLLPEQVTWPTEQSPRPVPVPPPGTAVDPVSPTPPETKPPVTPEPVPPVDPEVEADEPPRLVGACAVLDGDTMKVRGRLTSAGSVQFAVDPDDLTSFEDVLASGPHFGWSTSEVPTQATPVSLRAVSPEGTTGDWETGSLLVCNGK